MSFKDLGLSESVLAAVADAGYTEPTPIQAQAIPNVLGNRDVLGIAQTGTGKTAGFTLPMIDILSKGRARARMPRSLILEPTRELAAQVAESFETYGKNEKLSMALLIGGVSFAEQEKKLDRGVDVLIATPGRLLDHVERGKVLLNGVQVLVIDEADRMLDMGFIPDIERICQRLPFTRQTLFFSATMPPEIQRLTETFLHMPVRVEVARPATAAATVSQMMVHVGAKPWNKREALRELIRQEVELTNGIIFCNRKRDVDTLQRSLDKHGFNAAALHGDLDQRVRMATLEKFKNGEVKLLVASDVAARGLDIPEVSHVFNFDVPTHAEDYIHRIGRTGRAGREGKTFMIATRAESKYVSAIEDLTGQKIDTIKLKGFEETDTDDSSEEREPRRGRNDRRGRKRETDTKRERPKRDERQGQQEQQERPERQRSKPKNEKPADSIEKPAKREKSKGNATEAKGLGDHVPAFLMRPVPSTQRSPKKDDAA